MALFQDTAFWVLVSFTIFAVFAWKKGRGALLEKLDSRIDAIRKEIDFAESLRIEAQDLLAQYQRRQRDAAKEAQSIVDNAQRHAEQIRKDAEKELKESSVRREQQLQDRLRRIEENTVAEIRAYAAELAVKATREIIADKMDEKINARLVEASVKQVAGAV